MIKIQYLKTTVGELIIGEFEEQICLCDWRYRKMRDSIDKRIQSGLNTDYVEEKSELIDKCIIQIEEYLDAKRKEFDIPLKMLGSDFQQSVWNELIQIPYGTTESYLGLSKKLQNEKAIRAVASANGANAIAIIIPCHRIIGSDGKLIGYAGGLPAKKKLLELEGAIRKSEQLSLNF